MKLKNYILLDSSFVEVMKYFSKLRIPITIAFNLDKCLEVMQKELERISKHREELFRKHGVEKENEKGEKLIEIPSENMNVFSEEMNELLNLEFDIPVENKLEVSVKKIENIEISSEELNKLKMLIDFKE